MIQAVIEGIALRVGEVISAMNDLTPVCPPISVDDGMASNPYFCQFLSNVLKCDVRVPRFSELTAYGTARLAEGDQRLPAEEHSAHGEVDMYRPDFVSDHYQEKFREGVSRSKNWH
jgi:glycerol kinase